ncbi:MAG TPA: peptidoglycan-binding domain-containing protein [Streptosporangiaceae bacterium]|nr:peptidoglycan-binding domain-containing protein [Streptosporangiaceae bacterium]
MTADRAAGRRRRRAAAIAVPIVVAGATAGIVLSGPPWQSQHPAAVAAVTLASAPVVRTDLTNTIQVGGSLGYAGSYTVVNQAGGTAYTALPAPGATIRRGQELYEVDGTPVTLFYGPAPEWRSLSAGVTPGRDVAQLDRNLIALGYGAGLVVSDYFTGATAYAVELWQAARGLPVTGTVPLGQVAYAPGPLRITGVTPVPGSPPQPGTAIATATSPVPVVIAAVPVGQEYLVKTGDAVTVTLPDGVSTTPGVVTSVAAVASAGSGNAGSPPDGGTATQGPGGGTGQETVQMTVRLTKPAAAGHLDQAPVSVNIVSAQARDVLAVPVSALVALAGGGYAVDVVQGGTAHLVAVQTGLFAQTLVQVTGPGLTAGLRVQVPSS